MTDKQIIIDGVDVSGCELYRNDNGVFAPDGTAERTELCYLTNDYCGNNSNCYYKQLKRKEQECEELKERLYVQAKEKVKYIFELDQLKAENEELKKQLTILDDEDVVVEITTKQFEEYKKLKAENEELKTGLKQIQKQFGIEILYCKTTGESTFRSTKILKLKKAINEIKEIAQLACEKSVCDRNHCDYCSDGQIIQKISEVEDG